MIHHVKQLYFKMGVFSILLLLSLTSCEIEKIYPAIPPLTTEEPKPEPKPDDNKDTVDTKVPNNDHDQEIIGTGTGNLNVRNVDGKKYVIKAGTYSGIQIENVKNTTIDGLNAVKIINGNIDINKVDNLIMSGISIEDYTQAAIYIHSSANNLTLQNISFKNISNYGIRFDINNKYDGTPQSFSENIHLKNIHADNIGTLFISQGEIRSDGYYGLIKGFKLINSNVKNSPSINGLTSLGLAEDYELSSNVVDNVNASPNYPNGLNTHTAIFFAKGNGKVFNNKVTNYQGSVVRAWLLSITKPGTVEIYDNIAYNSTRYGAFELQVPPYMEELDNFSPANAKIYNNTIGLLNTGQPKYFEGRLLDLYQTYGNVEIFNNLSFDLRDDILINNMSNPKDTKITKNTNNLYFDKSEKAVYDLTNFKSRTQGVGAR